VGRKRGRKEENNQDGGEMSKPRFEQLGKKVPGSAGGKIRRKSPKKKHRDSRGVNFDSSAEGPLLTGTLGKGNSWFEGWEC